MGNSLDTTALEFENYTDGVHIGWSLTRHHRTGFKPICIITNCHVCGCFCSLLLRPCSGAASFKGCIRTQMTPQSAQQGAPSWKTSSNTTDECSVHSPNLRAAPDGSFVDQHTPKCSVASPPRTQPLCVKAEAPELGRCIDAFYGLGASCATSTPVCHQLNASSTKKHGLSFTWCQIVSVPTSCKLLPKPPVSNYCLLWGLCFFPTMFSMCILQS